MRIVIRQNLRGGPCDGEMKRAFVRADFDAEVWVPVRFDDCGIPTVTALYIADVSQDLIKDGELDLRFYGYYSCVASCSAKFTENIWRLKNMATEIRLLFGTRWRSDFDCKTASPINWRR